MLRLQSPWALPSLAATDAVDGYDQSTADNKEHEGEDPDRVPHVSQVQPVQRLFSAEAQLGEIYFPGTQQVVVRQDSRQVGDR